MMNHQNFVLLPSRMIPPFFCLIFYPSLLNIYLVTLAQLILFTGLAEG
jgi:hypothetical protein